MSFVLSPRRQILRSIYAIVGRTAPEETSSPAVENVTGNSRINVAESAAAFEAAPGDSDPPADLSSAGEDEEDKSNLSEADDSREKIADQASVMDGNTSSSSESFVDAVETASPQPVAEIPRVQNGVDNSPPVSPMAEPATKKRKLDSGPTHPPFLPLSTASPDPAKDDSHLALKLADPALGLDLGSPQSSPSTLSQPLSPTPRRNGSLGFPAGRLAVFEFDFTDLEPLGTTLDEIHIITASMDQNAVSLWIDTPEAEVSEDSVRVTSFLVNNKPVILVKSIEEILSLIRGQDLGSHSVVKVRRLAAESRLVLKVSPTSSLAKTVIKRKLLHPSNIQQYQLQCVELANVAAFIETILRAEGVSILFT